MVPEPELTATAVAAELLGVSAEAAAILEPEVPIAAAPTAPSTPAPSGSPSAEDLQRAATDALSRAPSQNSAADALDDAEWIIDGNELRIQTALSKTMLSMVINPEADKILRSAIRAAGAGALKLTLLPGTGANAGPQKPKAARTGSVQAKAMEHPIVQKAQELFGAEIRNVIDLRDN
jgi:DNA polymerase-3 subunit gamma/tau